MRRQPREHAGHRHVRLQEALFCELQGLLRDDLDDPRLRSVRPLAFELANDGKTARVHYGVLDVSVDLTAVALALARAAPYLRTQLAHAIDSKRVPELRFVFAARLTEEP